MPVRRAHVQSTLESRFVACAVLLTRGGAIVMYRLMIESLDQEGRGVAHLDGKVIFIEGALPGEIVEVCALPQKTQLRARAR